MFKINWPLHLPQAVDPILAEKSYMGDPGMIEAI